MRILFWNSVYLPHMGGVEVYTARLAAGLIARGHTVGVVAGRLPADTPEEEVMDGVFVYRLAFHEGLTHPDPMTRIRSMKQFTTRCAQIKRDFAPDVIHVNLADANALFHLRTQDAFPAPTVVTFQAALTQPSTASGNLTASLVALASRIVGVSGFAADNIAKFTCAPREAIDVVYPGVPVDDFAPAAVAPTAPPTIAFLGRLVEEKGAEVAVQALAGLPGQARLLVIGEGPRRAALEQLAAGLGLAERVIFAGRVDDETRKRLLADCLAMVVTSKHEELFGMVAVEGGLSGLAVVASRIGGLQEIVVPGETGELVTPGDAQALAAALAPLVAAPGLARKMGIAGRARCRTLFTVGKTVDDYERLYRESLESPGLSIPAS